MTSTIDRSFTGALDIEDQAVSATIRFAGDNVTLLVSGDAVGTWGRNEIEFVPEGSSYELRAEGDSIRFDPDDTRAFESFLTGSEPTSPPDTPLEGGTARNVAVIGSTPSPDPAQGEHGLDEDSDSAPAPGQIDQASLFSEDIEDHDPISDLSPSFATEEDDPEPAIRWDSTPDEMYAAGLDGSSNGSPAPPFRSALVRDHDTFEPGGQNDTEPGASTGKEDPVAYEIPVAPEPAGPTVVVEDDPAVPPIPAGMGDPETPLPSDPAPTRTEAAPDPDLVTGTATYPTSPGEGEEASEGGPRTGLAARFEGRREGIVGFAHSMVDAFRDRPADTVADGEPAFDDDTDDDSITPEPSDDRENLRQWGLVVAGGLVLLVLIAIVTWGLASMLGGDDPLEAVEEAPPTTSVTTAATVASTTSTTTPPPATISPENEAAAAGFVETWNRLANQYAYHLSISADSLPISVAPAPTVHLTYDEAGVLDLKMVPKGTGSDRDLLLAMGLAVAWGDPALTPEGRKEVLGAMGVNVEDPQLDEMGGSLSRNGVTYEATVSDGLIEFRVAPQA